MSNLAIIGIYCLGFAITFASLAIIFRFLEGPTTHRKAQEANINLVMIGSCIWPFTLIVLVFFGAMSGLYKLTKISLGYNKD